MKDRIIDEKTKEKKIIELLKNDPNMPVAEISRILRIPAEDVERIIANISDIRSKILIVDDEMDTLTPLTRSLENENYIVIGASNGNEALAKARSDIPDLILLDLMMPEMDGYEVCANLKENPLTEKIPVIMVTAKDAVGDKVKGLDTGADDYVTKPFNLDELKARIKSVLRRARYQ